MVYYSENQEAKHATNALLANRAALTQNMNIVPLKTKVSGSTHGTQQNELKNAPQKSTVQKLLEPTSSVAWTKRGGGCDLIKRGGGGVAGLHISTSALTVSEVSIAQKTCNREVMSLVCNLLCGIAARACTPKKKCRKSDNRSLTSRKTWLYAIQGNCC